MIVAAGIAPLCLRLLDMSLTGRTYSVNIINMIWFVALASYYNGNNPAVPSVIGYDRISSSLPGVRKQRYVFAATLLAWALTAMAGDSAAVCGMAATSCYGDYSIVMRYLSLMGLPLVALTTDALLVRSCAVHFIFLGNFMVLSILASSMDVMCSDVPFPLRFFTGLSCTMTTVFLGSMINFIGFSRNFTPPQDFASNENLTDHTRLRRTIKFPEKGPLVVKVAVSRTLR